jgi:hypothetical protein
MGLTSFNGISNIGDDTHGEIIRKSIGAYIDWAFLEAGAYFNVNIGASGVYGGDRSQLRLVKDPRATLGTVWEAYRQNWVYESGINRSNAPIQISGVYVNNTFLPINSGYYIDYENGRVVFNTPIATTSTVKVAYSHKWVDVSIDSSNLNRRVQNNSFRVDDNFFNQSGVRAILAEKQIQLPAIVIEPPVTRDYEGYQLGGNQWCRPDVVLHVFAEDEPTALKIANILSNQINGTIYAINIDRLSQDGKLPLKSNGSKNTSGINYPQIIAYSGDGGYRNTEAFQGGQINIITTEEQSNRQVNQNLYHCPVRWTVESVLLKI